MANLTKELSDTFTQEFLALQHNDGTDQYTVRKSFELYFDTDTSAQRDLVEFFQQKYKKLDYTSLRTQVFLACDLDRVHKSEDTRRFRVEVYGRLAGVDTEVHLYSQDDLSKDQALALCQQETGRCEIHLEAQE